MNALEQRLKDHARSLGFALVGVAPAGPSDGFEHLRDWLARGFAGSMDYMARHADARRHPEAVLPAVRSVIMVAMNYNPGPVERMLESGSHGRIARYAAGRDYHDVLRERLAALLAWVQAERPGVQGRGIVDTAPLLERDFARRAGLGWFGKNTMLIHKRLGSYFFLGALLLDTALAVDAPFDAAHCGRCTRCLDACPTDAFVGPYQLDARRCISYLTIELRGPVPEELRAGMGDWIFGCDICQEVCPWNRKAPIATEANFAPVGAGLSANLLEWLTLSEEEFRRRFKTTPLWRAKRRGLLRNVALVLGNTGDTSALPALERAAQDPESLIREAAIWAIAEIERRDESKRRHPEHDPVGRGAPA